MELMKIADVTQDKISALIYANPGNGKTTMLGQLKGKTLIIDVDRGTSVLIGSKADISVIRLDSELTDLWKVLEKLEKDCPFDNVCVDSLSELEKSMLTIYGRNGKNDGSPELIHYGRTQFKLSDICRRFRALPANVIFTAWETNVEHVFPSGEKYTQAKPMLSGKTSETICGLCEIVGRLQISTKEETEGQRFINLSASPTVFAKDRIFKRQGCKPENLLGK